MTNDEVRKLAMDLLKADDESEVIEILTHAGLWQDEASWRLYGDDENNFKTVGSQQARPEAALVEKLVNSVDARMMAACLRSGVAPDSADAPQSILEARQRFFGGSTTTDLARGITLAVTGARAKQPGMPCITICDIGEGQTPQDVPQTFLSIDKKNKLRIPFVQGKFNMGGTGALMFCGKRKVQLLITRRDTEIAEPNTQADLWSVTVVRRESPPGGPGQVRNPYFRYLAPVCVDERPNEGDLLTFSADSLEMMPDGKVAYSRPMEWGSCIKLYNYDMRGFKGRILGKNALLPRLEILLTEVALPIRVHECRAGFGGHSGSFDTNLVGLRERVENSKSDNLEDGYPDSITMNVQGEPMTAKIYAFKDDRAESYRSGQGVVFTINGQTHGWFPTSFFERKKVRMRRLAKSLLVVVDCTDISVDARADLFKNSRDRLSGADLRKDIEEELEHVIANHPGLRELKERRRRNEVAERLQDSKPLEDVLNMILQSSPSLSKLFLLGQRLSRPYRSGANGNSGGQGGSKNGAGSFKGKRHPSFFRFEKLRDNEQLNRSCEIGRRCRIKFATDVENEYFVRDRDRGRYVVEVIAGPLEGQELTTTLNLFNGNASWSIAIPEEDVAPGDELVVQFTVNDEVIPEPFVSVAKIEIAEKSSRTKGSRGSTNRNTGGGADGENGAGTGSGKSGKGDQDDRMGIELPEVVKVKEAQWKQYGFDEHAACTIIDDGTGDEDDERSAYTFYINVDNLYLQTDIKNGFDDPALVEARFVYGNVLVGLALIHDSRRIEKQKKQNSDAEEQQDETSVATTVENVTRALAPFMVPMIDYLGGMKDDDVAQLAAVGDEE
ncbi:MAG: hypothetical protein Tsb009_13870 [Planctomycetaceae bacterium]